MRTKGIFLAVLLSWTLLGLPAVASDDDLVPINFADNELVYEFVGQVTTFRRRHRLRWVPRTSMAICRWYRESRTFSAAVHITKRRPCSPSSMR
jgi:hypothetical protein